MGPSYRRLKPGMKEKGLKSDSCKLHTSRRQPWDSVEVAAAVYRSQTSSSFGPVAHLRSCLHFGSLGAFTDSGHRVADSRTPRASTTEPQNDYARVRTEGPNYEISKKSRLLRARPCYAHVCLSQCEKPEMQHHWGVCNQRSAINGAVGTKLNDVDGGRRQFFGILMT